MGQLARAIGQLPFPLDRRWALVAAFALATGPGDDDEEDDDDSSSGGNIDPDDDDEWDDDDEDDDEEPLQCRAKSTSFD